MAQSDPIGGAEFGGSGHVFWIFWTFWASCFVTGAVFGSFIALGSNTG